MHSPADPMFWFPLKILVCITDSVATYQMGAQGSGYERTRNLETAKVHKKNYTYRHGHETKLDSKSFSAFQGLS